MYEWIKAFHVIAVIAWMAGMLYLPRLFVYHCDAEVGSRESETFKMMEHRLLRYIINPAMIATWVLGLGLAWLGGFFTAGWLDAKLALVLLLSGIHGMLSRWRRDFASDRNRHSQKFYRIINEVPRCPRGGRPRRGHDPSRRMVRGLVEASLAATRLVVPAGMDLDLCPDGDRGRNRMAHRTGWPRPRVGARPLRDQWMP
jgi:putative membrane protein